MRIIKNIFCQKRNSMKSLNGLGVVFLSTFLLCGCAGSTGNQKLAETDLSTLNQMIIKDKTTKKEVDTIFGKPDDIDIMEDGREKWIYNHLESNLKLTGYIPFVNLLHTGTNDTKKKLIIIFRRGVVENFDSSLTFGESTYGILK